MASSDDALHAYSNTISKVLKRFWDGGEEFLGYRNSSLASLSASIGLQLLIVYLQNRKKGLGRILRQMFVVVTGMKAPLDAYKVAMGSEQEKDTEFDPMTEMTISKCAEIFTESIPGIMIQSSAIISTMERGGSSSFMAYLSLLVSVLTTGFVSSTVSYDLDTDPKKRAFNPEFYGYVPDSARKRASLFVTMIICSSVQVLMKSMLVVLLGWIAPSYASLYLLGELVLYLCYKMLRRDFQYWLPLNGMAGLAFSFLFRMVQKFVADFTGCAHFRHPYEVGGFYFTISYFSPLVGMFLVLNIKGGAAFNEADTLTFLKNLTSALGISSVVFAIVFFWLINKDYRHTFLSTETAGQMKRRVFLNGDDVMKAEIFASNKVYWEPIADKVAQWVKSGWHQWEVEKPDWFTDQWKTHVPAHMIPEKNKLAVSKIHGDTRRKSLLQALVRASETPQISPAAGNNGEIEKEIDVDEFIRDLKRNKVDVT